MDTTIGSTLMRARVWPYILLFTIAIIPRALAGRFLTIDEAYHWFERVHLFVEALRTGHYGATNLIGHPGVTTLWLGSLGTWLEQWLATAGMITGRDGALHRALLRLPVALACSVCVVIALPLLRRLVEERVALLACLLWASDPFLVAHGQLLHLDALLSSFMTLSVLGMLVAVTRPDRRISIRALLLSGLFGGLALLTKSPSVVLVPFIGLVLLLALLWSGERRLPVIILSIAGPLCAWLLLVATLWVILWPAAWVDLAGTLARVFLQAQADGGSPHGWGNYFLGHAVSDPGLLFYPVAIALRLTPWATVGLIVLASLALINTTRYGSSWWRAQLARTDRFTMILLAIFVACFLLMMSIPPKKFDRYALPVFPALDMLAAAGLWVLAERLATRFRRVSSSKQPAASYRRLLGWGIAGLIVAAQLAWYHPYELAYFNPLLGGGRLAAWAIPVGWGEGYELVADYLRTQPNGADRPVAALYEPVIDPLAPAEAVPMEWAYLPGKVDYAVLYIDQIQRGYKAQLVSGLLGKVTPVHTVTIQGIEYAYIYQIPLPVAHPLEASFGDAIRLRGYDLDTSAIRSQGVITVTLEWEGTATPERDYTMFVHVLDAAGNKIGQADVPPGGDRWQTSHWGAGRYISNIQQVPVRADAPAGSYHIAIGIYNPDGFARLPLHAPAGSPDPAAGPDALQLTTFELR